MHRAWGNQETKSSFCPPVLARDSFWYDYVIRLAGLHKFVGAKTVINPARPAPWSTKLFEFHCRHFYSSRYIFTFRDPLATILSTRDLQILLVGRTDGLPAIMRNYVDTVALFARMSRLLPNVRALCHEDIDRTIFDSLQEWLGIALPRSHQYYDPARVLSYDDAGLDEANRAHLAPIRKLYANLRQRIREGFATPQLDQNNNHLNPAHLTPLGHIARTAELIARDLPAATSDPVTKR